MNRVFFHWKGWLGCFLFLVFGGCIQMSADVPRQVAQWNPEGLGNHRAVVHVEAAAEVVWARVIWRRIDPFPELKGVVVTSTETGKMVKNVLLVNGHSDFGDVLFEASQPGDYYIYYMPYKTVKRDWNPFPEYLPTPTPSAVWAKGSAATVAESIQSNFANKVEQATLVRLESNGAENLFGKMEIPASEMETGFFLEKLSDRNLVVYYEPVSNPIKMTRRVPLEWIGRAPTTECQLKAAAGEYCVFQLGCIAPAKELNGLQAGCMGLADSEGKMISGLAARCLNLDGNDFQGRPLMKPLLLRQGEVLPLWFAIDVPPDTPPGTYNGKLVFSANNLRHTPYSVTLEVTDSTPPDSPFSRLSWLNSTVGLGDKFPGKFPAIKRAERVVEINAHAIGLSGNGLLEKMGEHFLAQPIEFRAKVADQWLSWTNLPIEFDESNLDALEWHGVSYADGVVLDVIAQAEPDGFIAMQLTLSSQQTVAIQDAQLVFSFAENSVPYFMGLGVKGGKRPQFIEWSWSNNANQFFWIGGVQEGLYCKLLDIAEQPSLYYLDRPCRDWCGDSRMGTIRGETQGDVVNLVVSTGEFRLERDAEKVYRFNLMLTPFNPVSDDGIRIPKIAAQKLYTGQLPDTVDALKMLPHADQVLFGYHPKLNPWLNYPFHVLGSLGEYAQELQKSGSQMQLVLGTREIPYQIDEFWPVWAMNPEIFTYTPAIKGALEKYGIEYADKPISFVGNSWLCEHLGEGYSASWLSNPAAGGEVVTLGINSRSRWQNYYLETVRSLAEAGVIQGVRTDLMDRHVTKRLRRLLDEVQNDAQIGFVTGDNFRPENGMANPMGQYLEHFSMVDRVSFSQGFSYGLAPDYYLVELSGIPFGVSTTFEGDYFWRSLLYGTLPQMDHSDKSLEDLWRVCDKFGLKDSTLLGYWDERTPIKSGDSDVLISSYVRGQSLLVVISSWAGVSVNVLLKCKDLEPFGFNSDEMTISIPEIAGLQKAKTLGSFGGVTVSPGKVMIALFQSGKEN